MSKFLITGGAGFIGANFCHYVVDKYPNDSFVCLDALTYAGNIKAIESLFSRPNFKFIKENICNMDGLNKVFLEEKFDYVINFAAETHVDNSIENPSIFYETNVNGTLNLLELCRKYGIKRFHQISTDEVYGSLSLTDLNILFKEDFPLNPSSPYSASKAAADLLVLAYYKTYNLPVTISRCSNNYGPYQHLEKLIPKTIFNAINNKIIPIYGTGINIRDWLFVKDHCTAVDLIIRNSETGKIYNIGGNNEKDNLTVVNMILDKLAKSKDLIVFVNDRLGHDMRYAIDSSLIKKELGWLPKYSFDEAILDTIDWYLDNQDWFI